MNRKIPGKVNIPLGYFWKAHHKRKVAKLYVSVNPPIETTLVYSLLGELIKKLSTRQGETHSWV